MQSSTEDKNNKSQETAAISSWGNEIPYCTDYDWFVYFPMPRIPMASPLFPFNKIPFVIHTFYVH